MKKEIEITTWDGQTISVALEPEATEFIMTRDDMLCFVAINSSNDFKWHLKMDFERKTIQVYPESEQHFEIEVFKNGKLIY